MSFYCFDELFSYSLTFHVQFHYLTRLISRNIIAKLVMKMIISNSPKCKHTYCRLMLIESHIYTSDSAFPVDDWSHFLIVWIHFPQAPFDINVSDTDWVLIAERWDENHSRVVLLSECGNEPEEAFSPGSNSEPLCVTPDGFSFHSELWMDTKRRWFPLYTPSESVAFSIPVTTCGPEQNEQSNIHFSVSVLWRDIIWDLI